MLLMLELSNSEDVSMILSFMLLLFINSLLAIAW